MELKCEVVNENAELELKFEFKDVELKGNEIVCNGLAI